MKTFFSKHRLFYCNNDIKQSTEAMVNCVIRINKFVGNHHTMEYQASKCAKVNDLCKASLVFVYCVTGETVCRGADIHQL